MFDESKHPRDEAGRFTDKNGGGARFGELVPGRGEPYVNVGEFDETLPRKKIEKELSRIMGISQNCINLGKLPLQSCVAIVNAVKLVYENFPCLSRWTKRLSYDENFTDGIAYSRGREIVLGKAFYNYAKLTVDYENCVRIGHFPFGTNANGIIAHEFGHQLNNLLTYNNIHGGNDYQKSSAVMSETILRLIGWNGGTKEARRNFIANNISFYATKNHSEMCAELFSEYVTSRRPRLAAIYYGKLLKESLKRL